MPFPNPSEESASFVLFTKAERIQQLNDIDKSITLLLQSAGLALKILTSSSQSTASPTHDRPHSNRRESFQSASNAYLKTLQSVDVRLRRQIFALEEADIIVGERKRKEDQEGKVTAKEEKDAADGGMGKLDIGWLNSRSGRVGRDNEAELWAKAKVFLEGLDEDMANGTANGGEDREQLNDGIMT